MHSFDITFRAPGRTVCAVRVGRGVLGPLADRLAADPPGRPLVVVTDRTVAPLHGEPLLRALRRRGVAVAQVVVPPGERSKSRRGLALVHDALAAAGAGRDAAVLALGGGVVGDLAGFAAATWHRGVPVIHAPTSLLAMVDAALGGKTAINVPAGKNLVGAFHQPLEVWADVATLGTLAAARYREGFAEMVKTAAVADGRLFARLEREAAALLAREDDALERPVAACLRIKGRIVAADERERGARAALNFGHTVAHALESVSRFRVAHGRAVAIGMAVEARLAERATGFPRADRERLEALLRAFGLPTAVPAGVDVDALLLATRRDKKARAGRARYALPESIGRMPATDPTVAVEERSVRAALRAASN